VPLAAHRGVWAPARAAVLSARGPGTSTPILPAVIECSPVACCARRSAQANTITPRLTSAARFEIASAPLGIPGRHSSVPALRNLKSFARIHEITRPYKLQILIAKRASEMALLGYARVSTQDQNLAGQLDALKAAGATTIYREKISGVRADRPQLAKLMASLKIGDVVMVTKLDRLGRSTRELLDLIERISKAGAAFRSLGDPLFDTTGAQGRLLVTMLAAIAEFERELIRERTGEGRKRAMAAGVKFGRKRKLSDYQRAEAIKRREAGETLAAIAESYAVATSMISRL
jgi:DNA invertase Pin-like site-specific DNA recombinase